MKRTLIIAAALGALTLVAQAQAAQTQVAQTQGFAHERRGFIVGLGSGHGGLGVEYERPAGKFESDEEDCGSGGNLRIGYGLSDRFTLTLDAAGFEQKDDGWQYNVGSLVALATYHVGGGGFFLRGGFGVGRLETKVPTDLAGSPAVAFEKTAPVIAFGLGYEWRVARNVGLGLAIDARAGAIDDFDDVKDVNFGHGTASVQFNWYL